ncbi:MAG: DNA gyrase inhibitor YacG [Deltaproteobacteria bacterium]|nr:DNA gyrase inhibitor YacG [Deltaproteobacteria bacterium]
MSPRCPICKKAVAPRAANPAFPFCSTRCKLVDLDRWLGEAYRIPAEPAGDGAGTPEEEP